MLKLKKRFLSKRKFSRVLPKLLSIGVGTSLMLAMVLNNGVAFYNDVANFAKEANPNYFYEEAKANHWGRSDLRAYLNNVEKVNNTLPVDSTVSGTNSANYPSHFSDAEYGLVHPFRYYTNVLDSDGNVTSKYWTIDKFWMPSGNVSQDKRLIISWGGEDISSDSQYAQATEYPARHLITMPYWGEGGFNWKLYQESEYMDNCLRSPYYGDASKVLCTNNDLGVTEGDVTANIDVAAAFKIDLSSVIFASAASAASIVGENDGGAKRFSFSSDEEVNVGFLDRGVPDFGMYLKTASSSSFSPTGYL